MEQFFTFSVAVVTALTLFTGKKEGCNDPDATIYNVDGNLVGARSIADFS
jgi:hypothetical protein